MAPSWFVSSFPGPLGRWLRRAQPVAAAAAEPPADPLLTVGLMLRRHREARGLSLRQLANETRISTPVLEALERGWRERLPETAYLRTMLPLLEQHLAMPAGSMANALPQQAPPVHDGWDSSRQPFLSRFTPGSIDVFTTWQGSVLYALISLGLLYGLNIQQQRLAAANQLTLRPVSPLPLAMQDGPADANDELLKAYPELRPLRLAERGVAMQRLRGLESGNAMPSAGVLRLQLAEPTRIDLSSESGERTQLQAARGELVLQMQPPIQLQLNPAPSRPAVFWDGQAVKAEATQPGRFRIPPAAETAVPSPAAGSRP